MKIHHELRFRDDRKKPELPIETRDSKKALKRRNAFQRWVKVTLHCLAPAYYKTVRGTLNFLDWLFMIICFIMFLVVEGWLFIGLMRLLRFG